MLIKGFSMLVNVDQGLLNVHMDIFEAVLKDELPRGDPITNLTERLGDQLGFLGRQNPYGREHFRVRNRTANIVRVQSSVKAHTFGELLYPPVGHRIEYP